MIPLRINGYTRWLSAPRGWEPDVDGPCGHLAIRDDELAALNAGGTVILTVVGRNHPPVAITVREPSK